MKKDFIICICAVVIGACGWLGSKEYERYEARKFAREQAALAIVAKQQLEAEKGRIIQEKQKKVEQVVQVTVAAHKEALTANRKQVETQLTGCKLSSIMLGAPNIAIIDKKGYEPGGQVPLAGGRTLTVTSIDPDSVELTDGQQAYRLSLPKARDLGASVP